MEELTIPMWGWAGFWGGLAGSALLLGAGVAWPLPCPAAPSPRQAFGSGVLISALAVDLMGVPLTKLTS